MAADAPCLDIADRRRFGLAESLEQWSQFREHLRVDTEGHGADDNADTASVGW
jgi:hypothetical protein